MKKPVADEQAGETPAADTPPPAPEAAPTLEHPSEGGSYIRQADGSLVKQEG